jgi:type III pantothenate kinase
MLVTIDVGNTNVVIGGFNGEKLVFEFRLRTDPQRTNDEYAGILVPLFERQFPKGQVFTGCIISSVVPPITPDMITLSEKLLGVTPLIVGPGIKTGLPIKLADPQAVGADRIVNAVAAKLLHGMPGLVVDFGTATSFDYVNAKGEYEGGAIAPGARSSLDSLVRNTAKLPRIELAWPKTLIGKSTVHAMQVGAVAGYGKMVDGLIDGIIEEVGPIPHVIATGGLGKLFSEHSTRIKLYDPYLTLQGMRLIWGMNKEQK